MISIFWPRFEPWMWFRCSLSRRACKPGELASPFTMIAPRFQRHPHCSHEPGPSYRVVLDGSRLKRLSLNKANCKCIELAPPHP